MNPRPPTGEGRIRLEQAAFLGGEFVLKLLNDCVHPE